MIRAGCIAALFFVIGCSADHAPPIASSTGEPEPAVGTAPTPPKTAATAAPDATSGASPRILPAATDPATLLGGGAALDALPTRATETGGRVDPGLRQRLMEPPP
ncbi:MAG: hypothetical protein HOV80_35880 [Polyangiaceae bacterium]|nr:hypothetical protein [Polyangiaceae bacterium]